MIEPRVKIKMKETAKGAEDHINVQEYRKGRTYEVTESLANAFITADPPLAVRVGKKDPAPEETKVAEPEETKEEEKEETQEETPPEPADKKKK